MHKTNFFFFNSFQTIRRFEKIVLIYARPRNTSTVSELLFAVYTSQLQEVSPSLPAAIMMDEEFTGSGDEETSSPQDYALASPADMSELHDHMDEPDMSPQSADNSDIEIDG